MKRTFLYLIAALVLAVPSLQAATRSWTYGGVNTNWSTPGNWAGGTPPEAGDSLVFVSGITSSENDFAAGTQFGSISMTGLVNYNLSGNAIQLAGDVSRDGSQSGTIGLDMELIGTTRIFDVGGTATRTLEITGLVSGTSAIEKTGEGMLRFRGKNNTFSGGVTVTAGVLASRGAFTSHFGTGTLTVNGGSVQLSAASTTVKDLAGSGGLIENGSVDQARTFTIDSDNLTGSSYAGVIQNGSGGDTGGILNLLKSGNGLLTLTGENTYTGATTISAGTLMVSNGGSLGNTAVTVNSGGTVGGNGGTIQGDVIVEDFAAMSFTLTNPAQTNLTLGGNVNLADESDLKLTLGFAAGGSNQFEILAIGGTRTGTFATINGVAFGVDNTFTLSHGGNDYNFQLIYGADSVIAQVVPEPGAAVLVGVALGSLLIFRRRVTR